MSTKEITVHWPSDLRRGDKVISVQANSGKCVTVDREVAS